MIHYLKADVFKIHREHKLRVSLGILLVLSLLSTFLLNGNAGYTGSLIQLIAQFITLFFIVPANLFFGEDLSYRTINNLIVKKQERKSIFIYKVMGTVFLDLIYVFLAYVMGSIMGMVLGNQLDVAFLLRAFVSQLPILICISLLSILLFLSLKKVSQAYLAYSLICLLCDNLSHLIVSNLLHIDMSSDYFLFASLQNTEAISPVTTGLSILFFAIYIVLSYLIFNRKSFK